jgi:hypothetical protein
MFQNVCSLAGSTKLKRRVKVENVTSPYVELLYGKPSKIIFDKKKSVSRNQFAKKYCFCNKGLSPKMLRIRKDCIKEEVQELFGPYNTKNGYRYCFNDDEEFIANVEELWMTTHQRT